MKQTGYLTPMPRATRIKPENHGAGREGDPSPWNENAVRALEDD